MDAHCHWGAVELRRTEGVWYPDVESLDDHFWVVNGTGPGDWEEVARWAARDSRVIPSFGLHPWKSGQGSSALEDQLRRFLHRYPRAGVGEIGLDKWIRNADLAQQKDVFSRQWRVALEEGRFLSLHCLQAFGHLAELLEELPRSPRGFLLHAYGGPWEMVPRFVELGAYFSFSGWFLWERKEKAREVFRQLPPDRLLVETDAPEMLPPAQYRKKELSLRGPDKERSLNHPLSIQSVLQGLAEVRGWSLEETVQRTWENARCFLGDSLPGGGKES